ncbi:hypothetical protein DSO57_1014708 [Entomophthora muscae]|uniref:Uncharacterized protein n=1 Tax=Entomophthora muscae TaxID=34485 RepID=A0ACC2T5G5_9FUNG|nr:hypothetical protein DSO57_1014708 [Entomophthora muscae]
MLSAIYQYFPTKGSDIHCVVCNYKYRKDAPLSTLQKHLRVKHGFSIRSPLPPEELEKAIQEAKEPVFSRYMGPAGAIKNQIQHPTPANSDVIRRVEDFKIVEPRPKKRKCPASLEKAIVKWINTDKVPITSATSASFLNMFRKLDPTIVLPSSKRIQTLLSEAANDIGDSPQNL